MTAVKSPPEAPAHSAQPAFSLYVKNYVAKVRGGDIGSLPAVAAILVLTAFFEVLRPSFLHANNIAALLTQGAGVVVIAMGLIFVLLIGEIDLSAGFTAGICATVMTLMMTRQPGFALPNGLGWYIAVPTAIVTGAAIGGLIGWLVSKIAIPSFVVTLAAYLAFQGVALSLLHGGNSVAIFDPTVLKIENSNLSPNASWGLCAVTVIAYAGFQFNRARVRARRNLISEPVTVTVARVAGLAILLVIAVYMLNIDRSSASAVYAIQGIPFVVPVIGILLLAWTFVLGRTAFGRHLYAVGGIILASRLNSVDPTTGGSDILLDSVGAAVIGGASLFGGRGRAINAVLGGLVIAIINNGMGLMNVSAGTKFIFTGSVLLLAAAVDALSRKRAAATT